MKDQRKTEIKVGLVVVVGIILFIWILTWAKSFSLSANDKIVKVKFKNVSGLEVGDEVAINGVKKGFVDDIKIQKDEVVVKLSIANDAVLKVDALFRIAMLDLMGGKKVEIYPGISEQMIDYSKVQTGSFTADIATVMSMVGGIQDDVNSSIKDMKITLNALNNYLTDKQLNDNIKSSVSNLSEASKKLNLMMDENRDNLKRLISSSVDLSEEAKTFLTRNKDELSNSFKDLKTLLEETNSLVSKANEFADEIKTKKNNVGKLLYDEELYSNLNKSITQLNELTKLILEQLKGDGFKVDANVDLF